MKTSSAGIALIKGFESCRLTAYPDIAGVWTIGWGHTADVKEGMTIAQSEADALLLADLARFEDCVNDAVAVPLTQNQFDALVSFTFNVGCAAFRNSTLLRLLNTGDSSGAALQFGEWVHAGGHISLGLQFRRQAETALFTSAAA